MNCAIFKAGTLHSGMFFHNFVPPFSVSGWLTELQALLGLSICMPEPVSIMCSMLFFHTISRYLWLMFYELYIIYPKNIHVRCIIQKKICVYINSPRLGGEGVRWCHQSASKAPRFSETFPWRVKPVIPVFFFKDRILPSPVLRSGLKGHSLC